MDGRNRSGAGGPLAVVGFGRFGRALLELVHSSTHLDRETRVTFRAYDPRAEVPPEVRAASLEELLEGARFVVLAVPVEVVGAVAQEVARVVENSGGDPPLVIDVGSVKSGPVEALTRVLGGRIPWVATHPLFGPSSILLGERPLRVVVCPNPLHPTAEDRARHLFESLGCSVSVQEADAHDRLMARTHALAFFLAKGLLDIGAGEDDPLAPPSFQAIARTVEAVRSDAGHLFLAIQDLNPHAREERKRLLSALLEIDRALEAAHSAGGGVTAISEGGGPAGVAEEALTIPDLGDQAAFLRETRDLIDDVDRDLMRLLGRRLELSRRAGSIKKKKGKAVHDPERERELLSVREGWASESELDPSWVRQLFESIVAVCRRIQEPEA
jgi:prephenate dehydrogenase